MLGIVALRRGEVENCLECVGPSSCIFPIAPEARPPQQAGSREAIGSSPRTWKNWPGDLRVRWLLNIAYMTLGEYPDKVPPKYLIPLEPFRSKLDVGRFENVATSAGPDVRGPNMAGGSIFDDFNGDGLPDLFVTSLDADRGASLFVNRGDGTSRTAPPPAGSRPGLRPERRRRPTSTTTATSTSCSCAGRWESPMRLSLLRNQGDGTFEDVTVAAGLASRSRRESAAWGDYDNDGSSTCSSAASTSPGRRSSASPRTPEPLPALPQRGGGTFRRRHRGRRHQRSLQRPETRLHGFLFGKPAPFRPFRSMITPAPVPGSADVPPPHPELRLQHIHHLRAEQSRESSSQT